MIKSETYSYKNPEYGNLLIQFSIMIASHMHGGFLLRHSKYGNQRLYEHQY